MDFLTMALIVLGLCLFETISSIDNAIINAEVLSTMSKKAKRWFLLWGILFAVFVVRGFLPWLIVWIATPELGPVGSLIAAFSSDPKVIHAVEASAPSLLAGGGIFLVFLFMHWLFLEEKHYGFPGERQLQSKQLLYYIVLAMVLIPLGWFSYQISHKMLVGILIGTGAFFITNGLKNNAQKSESSLIHSPMSDLSKIIYLEIIDMTFSIDGVLGAFAFTLAVPLIIAGNGLGAFIVREITVSNIETIKKYRFLKNGAMYSILFLGIIMMLDAFGIQIPKWVSPVITFVIVGYFFLISVKDIKANEKAG